MNPTSGLNPVVTFPFPHCSKQQAGASATSIIPAFAFHCIPSWFTSCPLHNTPPRALHAASATPPNSQGQRPAPSQPGPAAQEPRKPTRKTGRAEGPAHPARRTGTGLQPLRNGGRLPWAAGPVWDGAGPWPFSGPAHRASPQTTVPLTRPVPATRTPHSPFGKSGCVPPRARPSNISLLLHSLLFALLRVHSRFTPCPLRPARAPCPSPTPPHTTPPPEPPPISHAP